MPSAPAASRFFPGTSNEPARMNTNTRPSAMAVAHVLAAFARTRPPKNAARNDACTTAPPKPKMRQGLSRAASVMRANATIMNISNRMVPASTMADASTWSSARASASRMRPIEMMGTTNR